MMKRFTADLHVHSVLSPCGDLEMSPANILAAAKERNINILGISDHNSTRHCRLMTTLGREAGIVVIPGVEINTQEEIHCLAFFENSDNAEEFQVFLDKYLPEIPNDPRRFGDQIVVDRNEKIVEEVAWLLINAINTGIYDVAIEIRRLGGLFIPAHIDRSYNSILSQLEFIPTGLNPDALEVSANISVAQFRKLHPELNEYQFITSSDAHHPKQLGRATTIFEIEAANFREIRLALQNRCGRKVCHA
jgi:hypothetical protein